MIFLNLHFKKKIYFSTERGVCVGGAVQARRQWSNTFKILKWVCLAGSISRACKTLISGLVSSSFMLGVEII